MQILFPPSVYLMLYHLLCSQLLSKPKFSGVEKIKTIGSTYMAATGLNVAPGPDCTQARFFICIHFRTQTSTSESEWTFMADLVWFTSKNEKESFSYYHLHVGEGKKEIDMFIFTNEGLLIILLCNNNKTVTWNHFFPYLASISPQQYVWEN